MLHSRHACLARDFLASPLAGDGEGVSFEEPMLVLKSRDWEACGIWTYWSARFVFMLVLGVAEPGYGLVEDINGVGL